jgi:hypothetical protein
VLPLTGRIGFSWSDVPDDSADVIRKVVESSIALGASWFIDEAPIELRTDAWCGPRSSDSVLKLNAGVRGAFDPDARLNAGRFGPRS